MRPQKPGTTSGLSCPLFGHPFRLHLGTMRLEKLIHTAIDRYMHVVDAVGIDDPDHHRTNRRDQRGNGYNQRRQNFHVVSQNLNDTPVL